MEMKPNDRDSRKNEKEGKEKEQKWKTEGVEPNGGKLHTGDKCGNRSLFI